MRRFLVLLMVLLPACATHNLTQMQRERLAALKQPNEWTDGQRALLAGFVLASVADYGQSRYALEHPGEYRENNPLVGNGKDAPARLLALKLITIGGVYILADRLSTERRGPALAFLFVFQSSLVARHTVIGLRMTW